MEKESMKEQLIQGSLVVVKETMLDIDDNGTGGGHRSNGGDAVADSSFSLPTVALLSSLVAIVGSFTYGFAIAYSSSAEAGIMDDLGLSIEEYSVFSSVMIIGAMLSAFTCGKVTDLIGRRGTMWSSEIFSIMGWLAIAFGKGAWWLDFGRISLGFGVGLHCYAAPVYIGEITPNSIRGGCSVANQLMLTFGLSLMYFFGNIIAWRTLALLGTIPCLVQVIGLFFVPESPRWLLKIGQENRFEATLQQLRGENVDISKEATEIRAHNENLKRLPRSRFMNLFNKKHARLLLIAIGVTILGQLGGTFGIASYTSSILETAGCSPIIGTTAIAILQLPFSSLGVILTDRCGRRPLWMISASGTCLGNFLVGLAFLLQNLHQTKEYTAVMVLAGILIFSASYSAGMSGTQWIIMSEILPIEVKGSAGSLINVINWIGAWAVAYGFNFVFTWSKTGTFFFFASICGATVLFVSKLLPETRGRTLEEIQESPTFTMQ